MSGFGSDGMVVEVESAPTASMDEGTQKESEILYQYMTGELAYLDEDFDAALNRLSTASALTDQVVPPLHEKLAELYVRSGELDKALAESSRLLESDPKSVEYRMLHASILESTGQFDAAAQYYSGILKDEADRHDVVILLANVFIREGKFQEAEAVLKAVDKRGDADMLILFNLGRVAELQQDRKKALAYYQRSFAIEKRSPFVVGDILRLQIELEQYAEAEAFCKSVIEQQPENALARKVLSHLLLGDKKIDEALQQFEALESMDQGVGYETRLKIALIYMDKQNYKEAIRQLLLILSEDPTQDEARFYLASIYAGANRVRESLVELAKIEKGQKMYLKSLTFAAFLWRQDGNLEKAEETILEAYRVEPDDKRVIYYAIVILKDNNKPERAQEILEEALSLYPENEKFRFQYGVLLYDRGEVSQALKNLEVLLNTNPEHSDALNFIAYTLVEENGDIEKAREYARRALAIKPGDPYYMDTLGWVYFRQGEYAEAEKYLKQSVEKVGTDSVMLEHYADVLVKLNRNPEAIEYYKKAIENVPAEPESEKAESLKRLREKLTRLEADQARKEQKSAVQNG